METRNPTTLIDPMENHKQTSGPGENIVALLAALKKESLAHELVKVASAVEAGKQLDAVKGALQARVMAQSKVLKLCQE